jgi:hypothetical protein
MPYCQAKSYLAFIDTRVLCNIYMLVLPVVTILGLDNASYATWILYTRHVFLPRYRTKCCIRLLLYENDQVVCSRFNSRRLLWDSKLQARILMIFASNRPDYCATSPTNIL